MSFPWPIPLPACAFPDRISVPAITLETLPTGETVEVEGAPVLLPCRVQPANPTGDVVGRGPAAGGAVAPSGTYRVNIRLPAPLPAGVTIRTDSPIDHVSDSLGPIVPPQRYTALGPPVMPGVCPLISAARDL